MDAELRQLISDGDDNETKCRLAAAYAAGKRAGKLERPAWEELRESRRDRDWYDQGRADGIAEERAKQAQSQKERT